MSIITKIDAALYVDGVAQEDYDFELTADQTRAVEAIMAWWNRRMTSPAWKRFFVLAGAAGCVLPDTKIKIRKISDSGKHEMRTVKKEKDQ